MLIFGAMVRVPHCIVLFHMRGGSADYNLRVDLKFAEEQAYVLRKSSIINDLPIPLWSDPEAPSISQSYDMYVCSPCIILTLTLPGNQSTTPLPSSNRSISGLACSSAHTGKGNNGDCDQTARHRSTCGLGLLCMCSCQCLCRPSETGSV